MRTTETRKPNTHHRRSATKINNMNIVDQFRAAMATAGVVSDDPLMADGQLHRIHVESQRRGTKNGAYVLYGDSSPAGWFIDFVTGITGTWRIGGGRWELDEETRRQIERAKAQRKAEQDAKHAAAAMRARSIWEAATPCHEHFYLTRKGVEAHGLRVGQWQKWVGSPGDWSAISIPALLIPMRDKAGAIWNLQAIFSEPHPALGRDKDFLTGARKSGLFHEIGVPTTTVMICEGLATAATVHAMTGNHTFVAFDAGNLKPVSMTVRTMFPEAEIIIAGDNDHRTPGNPGATKAREAALAVGGKMSIPPFPDEAEGSDWNDYYGREAAHG